MNRSTFLLGLMLFLVIGSAYAQGSFIVANKSNETRPYLIVNGTTGKVGIGTPSPQATLHLVGSANLSKVLYIENKTVSNLEGATIRVGSQVIPLDEDGALESAGMYIKIDPVGSNNQLLGIYGEITTEQEDTEAAFIKIIHNGSGDAMYVALNNFSAVGFEAASFHDGTKGVLSTMQGSGMGNSVLFNALWEQITIPNYGMYYADQAPGHAFTIRKYAISPNATAQIRILEPDLSRTRFEVKNDGNLLLQSLAATTGDAIWSAPNITLTGSYRNTTNAVDRNAIIAHEVRNGSSELKVFMGDDGNERLQAVISNDSLNVSGTLNVLKSGNNYVAGNIGIGTLLPGQQLHVIGNVNVSQTINAPVLNTTRRDQNITISSGGGSIIFRLS